jgi:hypothetical protein
VAIDRDTRTAHRVGERRFGENQRFDRHKCPSGSSLTVHGPNWQWRMTDTEYAKIAVFKFKIRKIDDSQGSFLPH